jgi:DNA helicase-2/ATP-dependent DNA helicase PcrA
MFNKSQIEAVSHMEGPAIVLAGPGSGKTTVITHRIKNLIEKGISPEKIMVVTFTKAATLHMQKKFFSAMEGKDWVKGSYPVTFGTFHSIYYKILRLSYGYKGDNIITGRKQNDILREIILRKNIETENVFEFIQNILSEISKVKGNMISLHNYKAKCCKQEQFVLIFEEYEKALKAEGRIDFDDIILNCYKLFIERPDILKKWQKIFTYILIDEFQDINRIQYEVVKMLALPENNIFIVGDDDQSIYGFRGACPEIMSQFMTDFKKCRQIVMNINYRSTPEIVKVSEELIKNNRQRFEKNIISNNSHGRKVDVRQFRNQIEELDYMTQKMKQYMDEGIKPEEMVILVRNNSQIQAIENFLKNVSMEFSTKKSKNNLYKGKVGEDILSYVKAALSYDKMPLRENEHLMKILNKPERYISRQVIGNSSVEFKELMDMYSHSREVLKNIKQLQFHFDMIARLNPAAAVIYIRNGTGYEKYLHQYAIEHKFNFSDLNKQIDAIYNDANRYDTLSRWVEMADDDSHDKIKDENEGINIMTMHGAKGLEYKVVFILEANQGIIPTSKALIEQDFEEERRVFYVALTRAAEVLCVYGIAQSLGCEMEMSMFTKELMC